MRIKKVFGGSILLAMALVMGYGCATTQKAAQEDTSWKFHSIVDVASVQPYAVVPQPEGVMIIDSRPYKPKYVNGHIPTAVNIPGSQFDKHKGELPEDKNTLLIFYCGGPT